MSRSAKRRVRKIKNDRKVLIILSILILIFGLGIFINIIRNSKSHAKTYNSVLGSSSSVAITLSAVGDIMIHDDQLKAQYDIDTDSYSFDNNFEYISPYIKDSNLAIANLETTLAGKDAKYSSFPKFNSPDSLVTALSNSGFDIISTINNHAYDRGATGLYRTLSVIESEGLESLGTRNNSSENNFIIKNINDIRLGVTSFSYGEVSKNRTALNGLSVSNSDKDNINIFDYKDVDNAFESIKKTLDNMNENETDLQVLVIHWGNEYNRMPNDFQKKLAKMLCDYGVDIIIGSHPHVVQPIEMIKSDESDNETLVVYSLGNFLSNQRKEILNKNYTEDGIIVNIGITKNLETNETKVSQVEYIPTWVNKYKDSSNQLNYEIIPIVNESDILSIPNLDYNKVKTSYENTTSIIEDTDIIKVKSN
ncbi:MAG: CapA family protein [Paraclostridium sp.]